MTSHFTGTSYKLMEQFTSESVISADTVDTFKNLLDKFWKNQDMVYDYKSDWTGTDNRRWLIWINPLHIVHSFMLLFDGYWGIVPAPIFCFALLCRHCRLKQMRWLYAGPSYAICQFWLFARQCKSIADQWELLYILAAKWRFAWVMSLIRMRARIKLHTRVTVRA